MAVYAVGDLQGCFDPLRALLDRIGFDPARDRLWLCGDLVNRGPDSLACLRFVRDLGDAAVSVLGNHDLHLLAIAAGHAPLDDEGLAAVLRAPDGNDLVHWLSRRPLLHHDPDLGFTLVHAGLPPQWDLEQARARARELEAVLRGPECEAFLSRMYGDRPDRWRDDLAGIDRLRFICNAFTRLRYCHPDGRLELSAKGPPGTQPPGALPWFDVPGRRSAGERIVFGHWSTLGPLQRADVIALDTGCVWGGQLSAVRLDVEPPMRTVIDCPPLRTPGDE